MEARADSPEPLGGEGLEGAGGDAAAAPPPGGVLRRAWRGVRNWFRGGEEHFEPMNGGINPMFKTYIYPGEDLSRRRYLAAVVVVLAGFLWWLGPVLGLFVVDPLIQLQVSNMQVITPRTDCFDHKASDQDCDDQGVTHFYYFYNITNPAEWLAGSEPPAYAEVGPYAFKSWEKRYNISFSQRWTEVEYTYHPYYSFDADASCPTCTLGDRLTVVNRGYLQMISGVRANLQAKAQEAAAAGPPPPPPPVDDAAVKALMMPSLLPPVLAGIRAGLAAALGPFGEVQWHNCGPVMFPAGPPPAGQFSGAAFVTPDPTAPQPELCHYVASALSPGDATAGALQAAVSGAAAAQNLTQAAASAWLDAAIGGTFFNASTGQWEVDPEASEFLARFAALPRATFLATAGARGANLNGTLAAAQAAALAGVSDQGWAWLRGYLGYLAGTYGEDAFAAAPQPAKDYVWGMVLAGQAQWAAAATPTPATPEKAVVFQSMLPAAVRTVLREMSRTLTQILAQFNVPPAAVPQLAVQQWATCGALDGAMLPVGPGAFPHAPEFCAFLAANAASVGVPGFPLTPAMLADVGLALSPAQAAAFLQLVSGRSDAPLNPDSTHPDDYFASQAAAAIIQNPNMTAVLGWAQAALPPLAAQAATLAGPGGLTQAQYSALRLWLIWLLDTWGAVTYRGWLLRPQRAEGPVAGLLVSRPVRELLYGYEDAMLLGAAATDAAKANAPGAHRLQPWRYTPSLAIAFDAAEAPVQYFSAVVNASLSFGQLSYRDTDATPASSARYHPLIQQKRLVTGQAKGSEAQAVLQYRGLPFEMRARGILNATGLSEGIVQGPNFKTSTSPLSHESYLSRAVQAVFTGNHIEVKGVAAYQYTLAPASAAACNATAFEAWKAGAGFDEAAYQAARAELLYLKGASPAAYWALMQDPQALADHFNGTEVGRLGAVFTRDTPQEVLRCMPPEPEPYAWDFSETFACPTLHTLPRFYLAGESVVNTTGRPWAPSFKDHGWHFAVEPFTGFTIQGHKGYQFNQLVQRSDVAYPALWVAPGSGAGPLAASMRLDADFVTVPLAYVVLSWEPTRLSALALRGVVAAKEGLYWALIVAFPCGGWLLLFPVLVSLRFSRSAKVRRLALARIQKSTARRAKLPRHELAMAEALLKIAKGAAGVSLPPERLDDSDDWEVDTTAAGSLAGSGASTPAALPGKRGVSEISVSVDAKGGPGGDASPGSGPMLGGRRRRSSAGIPSRLSALEAKVAAAERHQAGAGAGAVGSPPAGSLSIFERAGAGAGAGGDAFRIAAGLQLPPPAFEGGWGAQAAAAQAPPAPEAEESQPDSVALSMLPGAGAADRAALEAYRRASGGVQLGGSRGGLRRRTTSTSNPEEP